LLLSIFASSYLIFGRYKEERREKLERSGAFNDGHEGSHRSNAENSR